MEVAQVLGDNPENNLPIDLLINLYSCVYKIDRFCHPLYGIFSTKATEKLGDIHIAAGAHLTAGTEP